MAPAHSDRIRAGAAAIVLRAEALAALGPTRVDDLAATAGGHSRAKAVGTSAVEATGLECALHGLRPEFNEVKGRENYPAAGKKSIRAVRRVATGGLATGR